MHIVERRNLGRGGRGKKRVEGLAESVPKRGPTTPRDEGVAWGLGIPG